MVGIQVSSPACAPEEFCCGWELGNCWKLGVKGGKGDSRIFFWNIFLIEFNNFLFNILIEIYFTYYKI